MKMYEGHHSISRGGGGGGGGGWSFCRGEIILFQSCSAARWKIQISLHVYIEHFWTVIIFFTQSLPEIIYLKKNSSPPPLEFERWPLSPCRLYYKVISGICNNGRCKTVNLRLHFEEKNGEDM